MDSESVETYNELLRLHQLNLELLETLELSLFWLKDFSNKNNIPIPNREKFTHLLNKIHALVTEVSSNQNLPIRRKNTVFKSDADEPDPQIVMLIY